MREKLLILALTVMLSLVNVVYSENEEGLLWKYETESEINSVAISADGEYIVAGSGTYYTIG